MSLFLPQELYHSVISHLDHDFGPGTRALLAIAQCSSTLRHEAQWILFRHPFLFLWQDKEQQQGGGISLISRHEEFLETILRAPDRLGPLVRSYNQCMISYNSKELENTGDSMLPKLDDPETRSGQRAHAFELTEQALPHMVNLKYLYFTAASILPASPKILLRCSFQLEIMDWFARGNNSATNTELLCCQQSLRHLDALYWDLASLNFHPDSFSKNLTSVKGGVEDLTSLVPGRNIFAFEYYPDVMLHSPHSRSLNKLSSPCTIAPSGLSALRYLSVATHKTYLDLVMESAPAEIFPCLRLLEISFGSSKEVSTYTRLPPNLEMLVLHDIFDRGSSLDDSSEIAKLAFTAAPQLGFVDVGVYQLNSGLLEVHRYRATSYQQSASAKVGSYKGTNTTSPEASQDKTMEMAGTILFGRRWGDSWWRQYAASLGWIATTDEITFRYVRR